MKYNKLIQLSGTSSILAGITFVLLGLSFVTQFFVGDVALAAAPILLSVGQLFEVIAIIGFFVKQPSPIVKISVVGFVLMIAGIVINIFPPTGRVLFLGGLLCFSIANQGTSILPSWGLWLWLIGSIVILVSSVIGGNLLLGFGILINAAALIWLGSSMQSNTPVT